MEERGTANSATYQETPWFAASGVPKTGAILRVPNILITVFEGLYWGPPIRETATRSLAANARREGLGSGGGGGGAADLWELRRDHGVRKFYCANYYKLPRFCLGIKNCLG